MSKNKKKPTNENSEMEKSNEVLTEVKRKPSKEEKAKLKEAKAKENAKAKKKAMKEAAPKRHRVKEIFPSSKSKTGQPSKKPANNRNSFGSGGCFYACRFRHRLSFVMANEPSCWLKIRAENPQRTKNYDRYIKIR